MGTKPELLEPLMQLEEQLPHPTTEACRDLLHLMHYIYRTRGAALQLETKFNKRNYATIDPTMVIPEPPLVPESPPKPLEPIEAAEQAAQRRAWKDHLENIEVTERDVLAKATEDAYVQATIISMGVTGLIKKAHKQDKKSEGNKKRRR